MAVSILEGFDYGGNLPNFSRDLFATVAEMAAFSEDYLPPVFECNVQEDGKRYRYNVNNTVDPVLGKWREAGGTGDLSNYFTKDETKEEIKSTKELAEANEKAIGNLEFFEDSGWADLVSAVNSLYNGFMASLVYTVVTTETGEKRKVLRITYRNGKQTDIDVTAIITETLIGELKNVDDTDIGDKQVLAWDEGFKQYRPKTFDLAGTLQTAKEYTDNQIVNSKKGSAIAVDEKPTYTEGETPKITYKQGGIIKETEDVNIWFYYNTDDTTVQTRWISGVEFTIDIGAIDLTEYVLKTDVKQAYTGEEIDKTKPVSTKALDDLYDLIKTQLVGDAEGISYTNNEHTEIDNVKKALDKLFQKVYYVAPKINSFTMTPSTTEYEIGQSVTQLNFEWAYNKSVTTQSLSQCTLADENVRSAEWTGNLTANATFTLSCGDEESTATSSKTIYFKHKRYYGAAELPDTFDSDFILGLSNKEFATSYKGTYKINATEGKYGFVCVPKSWGIPLTAKIFGFGTDLVDCGTVQFTNASGNTTEFKIVRTSASGLGSFDMIFE